MTTIYKQLNAMQSQLLPWLKSSPDGVVISSEIILSRNLQGLPFPARMSQENRHNQMHKIFSMLNKMDEFGWHFSFFAEMNELSKVEKLLLLERHIISKKLAKHGAGSGVAITENEELSIMVNEDDHLIIKIADTGLELLKLWEEIDEFDDKLAKKIDYAFSKKLGFYTASPAKVGTALQARVTLQLTGLFLDGQMEEIANSATNLGLIIEPAITAKSMIPGNRFAIRNLGTLGWNEKTLIQTVNDFVEELIQQELNARSRVFSYKKSLLYNHIGRAYGTLKNCFLINSHEAENLLVTLKFGASMNIFDKINEETINELIIATQPGHLQFGNAKSSDYELDAQRAKLIRETLSR